MWGFHHCRKLPAGSIMFHPRKCASPPGCQNAALPITPTKHLRVAPLITDSRETPVRKVCSSFVQEQFHRENPVTRPGFVRIASRGPVRNGQTRPSKFPGSRSCGLQKECPTKDGLSVAFRPRFRSRSRLQVCCLFAETRNAGQFYAARLWVGCWLFRRFHSMYVIWSSAM